MTDIQQHTRGAIQDLPRSMMAAVLYGQKDVRVQEMPVPEPEPGEVMLAVEAALTDGTDLKVYRRGYHARMITPPAIFGHEFAGRIAAVGAGVEGWKVGDRVVGANSAPCGACFHCLRQEESLCEDLIFVNGAYASYLVLPRRITQFNLLPVPQRISAAEAALTEPLACVIKGIRDIQVRPGEILAVIGSGPIGLMAARVASLAGARVIVVGRRPEQIEIAFGMGAQEVILREEGSCLVDLLRQANHGRGPDRVFEATGSPAVWEEAMEVARIGGRVNLFGGCPVGTRVSFETNRFHYGEITVCSSFHHTPADIRKALEMIGSGAIQPRLLFDSEEPLDRLPRVLQEMDDRVRTLKTVIRPPGQA